MAVIKADAYGHGDQVVGKFSSENGIRHFAVSNIDEAIHIRKAHIEGQILMAMMLQWQCRYLLEIR